MAVVRTLQLLLLSGRFLLDPGSNFLFKFEIKRLWFIVVKRRKGFRLDKRVEGSLNLTEIFFRLRPVGLV